MSYRETHRKINTHRAQISALREQIRALQQAVEGEPVDDYIFNSTDGPRSLSSLFGDKDTLFVVHNMGSSCPYCTQWADGFNGLRHHLLDRAAFVLSSPDSPNEQAAFAAERDWALPMVSHRDNNFASDMGYSTVQQGQQQFSPGVSVFKRQDQQLLRAADCSFGPGDDFNPLWHLFDMIPEGVDGWQAKFAYP